MLYMRGKSRVNYIREGLSIILDGREEMKSKLYLRGNERLIISDLRGNYTRDGREGLYIYEREGQG